MKQAFSFDRGRVASPRVLSPLYVVGKWDMPRNNGPPNQSLCFAILIKCHEQTEIIIYHINRLKKKYEWRKTIRWCGPDHFCFRTPRTAFHFPGALSLLGAYKEVSIWIAKLGAVLVDHMLNYDQDLGFRR